MIEPYLRSREKGRELHKDRRPAFDGKGLTVLPEDVQRWEIFFIFRGKV